MTAGLEDNGSYDGHRFRSNIEAISRISTLVDGFWNDAEICRPDTSDEKLDEMLPIAKCVPDFMSISCIVINLISPDSC